MTPEAETLAVLAQIEEAQDSLFARLSAIKLSRLTERPVSGDWLPMEHVRHLIFAEQHHFAAYLERGFRWSSVGVAPPNRTGERRLNPVGRDPAATVDDVFDAWAKVHAVVRQLCIEARGELTGKLQGNLHHVTIHAETIEHLLSS